MLSSNPIDICFPSNVFFEKLKYFNLPLKSINSLSLISCFLYIIKCSNNKSKDPNLPENVSLKEKNTIISIDDVEPPRIIDGLMSFSFDKNNFTNFKCDINDLYLSSEVPKKPRIYHNDPIANFIYVFCLFFQYVELKNNDEFKKIVENQFVCHQSKIFFLKNYLRESYVYDPKTFKEHLSQLDCFIENILEGKCPNMITVKEENGRILITPSNLNKCHLKSLEEFSVNFHDCYLDIEIETLIMELYWRYNQMNALETCGCSLQVKQSKLSFIKQCKSCKGHSSTIRTLVLSIISLLEVKKSLSSVDSKSNCGHYFSIFAIKCSNDDPIGHVAEIILKLKVKSLNENLTPNATIFLNFPEEHLESLKMLRNIRKQSLQNNTKIEHRTKL